MQRAAFHKCSLAPFYIQSEQVSLVASSENEIERSPRARIVPSGLNGRGRPEMFVAIIICLRSHRYKRDPARTSSSSSSPPFPFLSSHRSRSSASDLTVLSLGFSTSISYLPGTSLVPFLLPFGERALNCPVVLDGGLRVEEILEQIGSPRGQTGKGART